MKKDLLGISDLSRDEIYRVLETADAMREIGERPIKKVPTLRGKTIVNLFYEPSTRTRTSFEIAEKRLSADTLSIAVASSSMLKGETLADTAMNIEAMAPDMIVVRHASSGACHFLARICRSRIINAGDGMHEHPTQALLDAYTILIQPGGSRSSRWLSLHMSNSARVDYFERTGVPSGTVSIWLSRSYVRLPSSGMLHPRSAVRALLHH